MHQAGVVHVGEAVGLLGNDAVLEVPFCGLLSVGESWAPEPAALPADGDGRVEQVCAVVLVVCCRWICSVAQRLRSWRRGMLV